MLTKSLAPDIDCCAGTAPTDPKDGQVYSCIFCDKEWCYIAEAGGWYESWDTFNGGAK